MSAMTRFGDLLDRDGGDEWLRLSRLLEEIRGVTEHDRGPYPELVIEGQERDDGSALFHQTCVGL